LSFLDLIRLEYDFEDQLNRKVDLVEKRTVKSNRNWLRRREILNNSQVIYESRSVLFIRSSKFKVIS